MSQRVCWTATYAAVKFTCGAPAEDVNILPIFPQHADDGKRDDERDTTPFLSAFQSRFYNCGDFACN